MAVDNQVWNENKLFSEDDERHQIIMPNYKKKQNDLFDSL